MKTRIIEDNVLSTHLTHKFRGFTLNHDVVDASCYTRTCENSTFFLHFLQMM